MSGSWVLSGAQLVDEHGSRTVDLEVAGERVAGVAPAGTLARGAGRVLKGDGLWLLPGVVDQHFHCRAPAHPHREDFTTGSAAAAAGGVTTLFEMPISDPAAYNGQILNDRRRVGERDSLVDFGLYAAPGTCDPGDIESARAAGAIAYKIFLHSAPPEREREFRGICVTDTGHLYRVMRAVAPTGRVLVAHCEDEAILQAVEAEYDGSQGWGPTVHGRLRPHAAEVASVGVLLSVAEVTGARVHVAHVSCAQVIPLLLAARARGVQATAETCPHYLAFDESVMERVGPFAKVNPPIRTAADVAVMWDAVKAGHFQAITSDHSPFPPQEKEPGWTDIRRAFSGSPGVEAMLTYVMHKAQEGVISPSEAVRLLSANPARQFGIYPRKGCLSPGSDADFVLYDPAGRTALEPERMQTKARASARLWAGIPMRGRVIATYLRGREVYREGKITAQPGSARFVFPGYSEGQTP